MKNTKYNEAHNRCGEREMKWEVGQQQKYTKYLFRRNQFYGNSVFIATKKQPPKGAAQRRRRRRRWRSQICALNYAELGISQRVWVCVCELMWVSVSECVYTEVFPVCASVCVHLCAWVLKRAWKRCQSGKKIKQQQQVKRSVGSGLQSQETRAWHIVCACVCGLVGVWVELLN